MNVKVELFGKVEDKLVDLITLSNKNGMSISVTNYGCIVTSINIPDKEGTQKNIVLGYDKLDDYLAGHPFFGAVAGRFANRIKDGIFNLNEKTYQLETNELPTSQHLHGGTKGFDKYVWNYQIITNEIKTSIVFNRISIDGESGYPGNLDVTHTISLDQKDQIHYDFKATTDQLTILNLVNHSYYNLDGDDQGTILDHQIYIAADFYTPVDERMIPTGEILSVIGSSLDFTQLTNIDKNSQKRTNGLIDYNFILNKDKKESEYYYAAKLISSNSKRMMEVLTTQPALQFYNGAKLGNKVWIGRHGKQYPAFAGLCLETQHYPDSMNHPHFPTVQLKPNEIFEQKTIHRFSWLL